MFWKTARMTFHRFSGISFLCALLLPTSRPNAEVTYTLTKMNLSAQNVTMRPDHTIASVNQGTVTLPYDVPVIENEYLKIQLLPGWGGRIRSVVYKPTGNEETNPGNIGGPSSLGAGSFFYDYLWVNGGFYPTIGPEHGKYFNLPWDWKVVKQTKDTVEVGMYMTDSIPWRQGYASKFSAYYATMLRFSYVVKLITGRTDIEVEVTIKNPANQAHKYEYWSNTSMFPGAGNSAGYEMIAPVETIQIDSWCTGLMGLDPASGGNSHYIFNKLRWIKNWPTAGILYAHNYPFTFWGVIDHNTPGEEGIIRVCDNKHTIGLKVWGNPPSLFEPWGGTTNRFFTMVSIAANETKSWKEYYTPTVGLSNMTDASGQALVNLTTDKAAYDGTMNDSVRISCQYFCTRPDRRITARLWLEGGGAMQTLSETEAQPNPKAGNAVRLAVPVKQVYNGVTKLCASFTDATTGALLLASSKTLSFKNASSQVGVIDRPLIRPFASRIDGNVKIYTCTGRLLSETRSHDDLSTHTGMGVLIMRDSHGNLKKGVSIR